MMSFYNTVSPWSSAYLDHLPAGQLRLMGHRPQRIATKYGTHWSAPLPVDAKPSNLQYDVGRSHRMNQ
jgi:hypothetical protein